jgi:uncharacterized Fe-S cluster-containing radical SAM superfamily protein
MLSRARLVKRLRNARHVVATNFNRAVRREFIPRQSGGINIETSSICNLNCAFCAYPKKQSPKVIMSNDLFQNYVGQALEMGYHHFDLTPCTGDIFMDRNIFKKFEFLERTSRVKSYAFFTNFTIPKRKDIERLFALRKISDIAISVYGHDLVSFIAITKARENVYWRLVSNLETLFGLLGQQHFQLRLGFHEARRPFHRSRSDLTRIVEKIERSGIPVRRYKSLYNNWGGYVTQDDVAGLPIEVGGINEIYKNGACVRLLTSVQIMATGIVNGCACRDPDATLRIGDLKRSLLREIISSKNPTYMQLIAEQQKGEFQSVCKSCDFYSSVYHNSRGYRRSGTELVSLEEFVVNLDTPRTQLDNQ